MAEDYAHATLAAALAHFRMPAEGNRPEFLEYRPWVLAAHPTWISCMSRKTEPYPVAIVYFRAPHAGLLDYYLDSHSTPPVWRNGFDGQPPGELLADDLSARFSLMLYRGEQVWRDV